jgi:hypothetical protein
MGSSMLKDAKPPLATAGGRGACRDILGGGALWVRWAILVSGARRIETGGPAI